MRKGKLVLIDGHALAYRAYHALQPGRMGTSRGEQVTVLRTSQGELTNATYGFTSMLLGVLRDEQPDYIAVAFDAGPSFRHKEYAEYKAHREKMPDDLAVQLKRIRQIVEAFNIPVFELSGYEADDLLGTLARQAAEEGLDVLIVTGDTDAFQLVNPRVKVLTSGRRFSDTIIYDEHRIKERYGVSPEQLADYKALVGDKSDNIPGVRGIGQKTAAMLLQKYGTVENIYEHLDEIKPERVRRALEQGKASALLSKRLATIVTNAPVQLDLEACRAAGYDRERVMKLFRELEFRSLVKRLPEPGARQMRLFAEPRPSPGPQQLGTYQVIADRTALRKLVESCLQARAIALDTETTSTDPMMAELVGISLAFEEGEGYYIPVGHLSGPQLPLEEVLETLRPLLEDASIAKYAHHAKYDMAVLSQYGVQVKGLAFDTMVAAWLLDPEGRYLSLKSLAWKRLGVEMKELSELIGKGKKQITMAEVPIEEAAPYAAADADMTFRLVKPLERELREKALWSLFSEVEMPLVPVLMDMEMAGVALDVPFLMDMSRSLHQQLVELEEQIHQMVGYRFNVNSTQQLSDALFVKLGLPTKDVPRTSSGKYSTAADVLEKLRGLHPVIELLLRYRELSKIKSTYVDALPQLVNPRTGRVHTSYNQTGTVTGRISSSEPNLQNIPARGEWGRRVRRAFIAAPGCVLLSADYSQVELRILAHISQDRELMAAFRRGEDIHAATASAILGVPTDKVTPDMRRLAKTINFGVTYGMGPHGLHQQTGMSHEEAARYIANYFARYPGVRAYVEETKRKAREQGYVETLLGRRRYFPELASKGRVHANVRAAAERMAINMPIQGSAADIIKIAMIRLHRALKERHRRTLLILQVHDELVLEVPEEEREAMKPLVKEIMEGAYKLDVPLKVDLKEGKNWGEMEPCD